MKTRHLRETSKPKNVPSPACEELNDGTFLGVLGYRKCMKGSKLSPAKARLLEQLQKGMGN